MRSATIWQNIVLVPCEGILLSLWNRNLSQAERIAIEFVGKVQATFGYREVNVSDAGDHRGKDIAEICSVDSEVKRGMQA